MGKLVGMLSSRKGPRHSAPVAREPAWLAPENVAISNISQQLCRVEANAKRAEWTVEMANTVLGLF